MHKTFFLVFICCFIFSSALSVSQEIPGALFGYSDYQTPNSIALWWNDPVTTIMGAPISNYTIRIYRNGQAIAVVDSGVEQYTDTGLNLHQSYQYRMRAVSGPDTSAYSNIVTVYAGGHATPKPPTNFSIMSFDAGAALSWRNPSRQLDNTPLNDLAYIKIFRDYKLFDSIAISTSDTGRAMEYIDTMQGYHYYQVYAYDNETPLHRNWTTLLIGYGGETYTSFFENFDSGKGLISVIGTWDTTRQIAYSGYTSFTDNTDSSLSENVQAQFLLPPVRVSSNFILQFKEIGLVQEENRGSITITPFNKTLSFLGYTQSTDYPEWSDGVLEDADWMTRTFDLSQYIGDTVAIGFSLAFGAEILLDGWFIDDIFVGSPVGVGDESGVTLPAISHLEQNYPNPFNPTTIIKYAVADENSGGALTRVSLKVYDVLGREVATLVDEFQHAGTYSVPWDAGSNPGGMYFYRLQAGSYSENKKMLLLR